MTDLERPRSSRKWSRGPRSAATDSTYKLVLAAISAREELREARIAGTASIVSLQQRRDVAYDQVRYAVKGLVLAAVRRYAGMADREDLVAAGHLGLIGALEMYQTQRAGGGWSGYIGTRIFWRVQQQARARRICRETPSGLNLDLITHG